MNATRPSSAAFVRIFAKVAPSMLLGALDGAIVAAALPVIGAEFGSISDMAWIVTLYLLAATVAAPIYGRLGDALGRRKVLVSALVLFVFGTLIAGLAPNLPVLLAGRFIQGTGGGGLMVLAQALIGEVVTPRERGRFSAWFGALFAAASTLGPLIGGLLAEHAGWRWVFLANLPLAVIAFWAVLRIAAVPGTGGLKPDWAGALLFVGGTLAALIVLSEGGQSWPWFSLMSIGLFLAAVVVLICAVLVERRAEDPLIPLDLMASPVIWRASVGVIANTAIMYGLIVALPLYAVTMAGRSPSEAGALLVPFTLAQVAFSIWSGRRIADSARPKHFNRNALFLTAAGCLALAASAPLGLWALLGASVLTGFGLGGVMPAAQTAVQWTAGQTRLGSATAAVSFSRSIGGVIGAALATGILTAVAISLGVGDALVGAAGGPASDANLAIAYSAIFLVFSGLALAAALVIAFGPDVDVSEDGPLSPQRVKVLAS